YHPGGVLDAVRRLLAPLGGMKRFVSSGSRVLLKPNLVLGKPTARAVNTHPEIVRAAAVLAFEAGAARVAVGDSPGYGTAGSAARACGLAAVTAELGLELIEFTPAEKISRDRAFPRLELAREMLAAEVVINLPKMKTHSQMLMTLAVKNLFGAVPGARKLQWHYRAGRDRLLFARALNEIALAVRPALSILDAVVGMDGRGPTAGRARPVGFLAAGADPWAVDAAVMDVLGVERTLLFTLAAASEYGPRGWEGVRILGAAPESLRPADWTIPELETLQMHGGIVERHLPRLAAWLRSRISPKPIPGPKCVVCGRCVEICPAKAMRLDHRKVAINDSDCVRCYCCHELCPYEGMNIVSGGLLARLLGLYTGVR
ncbi:MAG: DUF362 domain-containing protein, partial [Planctomycetes bacterium]|nr:DUF362 domain-containing protein [Planctomycetota bacterium]